jgi:hypothetical protein
MTTDGTELFVFDTSTISQIFRSFYQNQFPSFGNVLTNWR